jgi:hypothetical protein
MRVGRFLRRVLVAEVVQPHGLLDVLEAVQVLERQTVGLPSGSAMLAEHVVVEPRAREGELVVLVWECRGPSFLTHHVSGPS